jgi:hypothetical protein
LVTWACWVAQGTFEGPLAVADGAATAANDPKATVATRATAVVRNAFMRVLWVLDEPRG